MDKKDGTTEAGARLRHEYKQDHAHEYKQECESDHVGAYEQECVYETMEAGDRRDQSPLKLSVLDLVPVLDGASAGEALEEAAQLAILAERLGYHRYWAAEHHDMPGLACAAPEVLLAHIGARTERIRLGTGALLLPHYRPLKVAEQFHLLATLYPGRIDLGIGRAPGGSAHVSMALSGNFLANVRELPAALQAVADLTQDRYSYEGERVSARPLPPAAPELWLLGTNSRSAAYAAQFGMNYAFGQFMSDTAAAPVLAAYRGAFAPSAALQTPRAMVAVGVVCADTDAEAQALAARMPQLFRGEGAASADAGAHASSASKRSASTEAAVHAEPALSSADQAALPSSASPAAPSAGPGPAERLLAGTPTAVAVRLRELAAAYGVDEFIVVTMIPDYAARRRSYELLTHALLGEPTCS